MTIAIHIDLLHFIGAKAFIDTLARGKDAFTPAVHEAMALAYTVLNKEYPQSAPFDQALNAQATIYKSGMTAFASGLASKGESGIKDAARQVYESVFAAAGLPTTGLFKDANQAPDQAPDQDAAPASPTVVASPDIVAYVTKKVSTCIADQLGVQREQVTPTKELVADFGADSLDLIELTMAIEDEVEIEIQDEDAERVVVVQDAIDLAVRMLLQQKTPLPR